MMEANVDTVESIDVLESDVIEALADYVQITRGDGERPIGRFVLVGEGKYRMAEYHELDGDEPDDLPHIDVSTVVDIEVGEIRDEFDLITGEDSTNSVEINVV